MACRTDCPGVARLPAAVVRRPGLQYGHLAAGRCPGLADPPDHELGLSAGHGQRRGKPAGADAVDLRRRYGRSIRPSHIADGGTVGVDDPHPDHGVLDGDSRHQHRLVVNPCAAHRHCLRPQLSGLAVVRRRSGTEIQPDECHRAELRPIQRCPRGRACRGRRTDRADRNRGLLHAERPQFPGGSGGAGS